MDRQQRHERYTSPTHAARQDAAIGRVRRSFSGNQGTGPENGHGNGPGNGHGTGPGNGPENGPGADPRNHPVGSVRHSVTVLAGVALAAELGLGLVGGLPGLGLGAVLLGSAALLTARYTAGAASQDHGYRRGERLMSSRAPGLGEWYWTVSNGLDPNGYPAALRPQLQRLYAARLSERHGVSLWTEPARAAALVGPTAWPWIDPEHAAPSATVPHRTLEDLVRRLESL